MQLSNKATRRAAETFLTLEQRLHNIHNHVYNYSLVIYITSKTKVSIICPVHGLFKQAIDKHLQGRGCPLCANQRRGDCKRSSTEDFITKATAVHGIKYTYYNTMYGDISSDAVTITCPIHGEFEQAAKHHLAGHRCNKCAELVRRSNYLDEPTILYYLHFTNANVYKIGITVERRGIVHRYCADKEPYIVLFSKTFNTGEQAYNKEQEILNTYSMYKYTGIPILIGGNSELFTEDILKDKYDKNEQYIEDEDKG